MKWQIHPVVLVSLLVVIFSIEELRYDSQHGEGYDLSHFDE